MKLEGLKMNFLGDSITEGVGASSIDKVYWKRFEKDGAVVCGNGIGGTRIARQHTPSCEERWDRYFASRIEELDPEADVVVVFGGTNDYGHGDAPLGRMEDRNPDTFYGALHDLYSRLMKKYPAARIIPMTPLHRTEENKYINEIGVRNVGSLGDYVAIIREVAEYYALPLLDLYALSSMQPELPYNNEKFYVDGLHPSDEGYERIYNLLKAHILSLAE